MSDGSDGKSEGFYLIFRGISRGVGYTTILGVGAAVILHHKRI